MYKEDLTLNNLQSEHNLQGMICHKTRTLPSQTNLKSHFLHACSRSIERYNKTNSPQCF